MLSNRNDLRYRINGKRKGRSNRERPSLLAPGSVFVGDCSNTANRTVKSFDGIAHVCLYGRRREGESGISRVVNRVEAFGLWIISVPIRPCIGSILGNRDAKLSLPVLARSYGLQFLGGCRRLPAGRQVERNVPDREGLST